MANVTSSSPRLNGPFADEFEKYATFANNTLDLDPNDWNQVFVLHIEDGEAFLMGIGNSSNPLKAEGYIGARLMDDTATTAVQIEGKWRLAVRTKGSRSHVDTLASGSLGRIDSRDSAGDPLKDSELTPLPETDNELTTKEYVITFEVRPRTAITVDTAPDSGTTEFFADGYHVERSA